MKLFKKWVRISLYAAFVGVIVFVGLDKASVHFLKPRSSFEARFPVEVVRTPKPYVMFGGKSRGTLANGEQLNELGYRGKAPAENKPEDEYRVIVLGGSTVFGGNTSIPEALESRFRDAGCSRVRVYNFGVVSSVSGQELARIVFEVLDISPDLIVIYNGYNDLSTPLDYDPRPGYPFNFVVYENNPLLKNMQAAYPMWLLVAYRSNLLRYFLLDYFVDRFTSIKKLRQQISPLRGAVMGDIAKIYVGNMFKAQKIAEKFNVPLMIFFQPNIYFTKPFYEPAREQYLYFEPRISYFLRVKELILKRVDNIKEHAMFNFYDISDVLDGQPQKVYSDNAHVLDGMNELIMEAIYAQINQKLPQICSAT